MKLFGQDKEEFTVLVVREADEVAEAVDQALKTAGPEERPGLERAAALLAAAREATDGELRGNWVRRKMAEAGVKGRADSVRAVKALREAEPGLSLLQAVRLSQEAAALEDQERHGRTA
ncbi:hypothetical protein [Streptomyces sp. IB2014 016-6]|uniref:hypothetical protein n=1 Tax=Streptomyces sp. IB2014 016-6 TaxID=2517818 RepID=UPI0011C8DF25|nr:hypothetical protein [Streptomyces sp. IB2014 016-6]TXL90224.1 hypothetical protein EW053_10250 [Streptomyces sp. IB2014 016-6]